MNSKPQSAPAVQTGYIMPVEVSDRLCVLQSVILRTDQYLRELGSHTDVSRIALSVAFHDFRATLLAEFHDSFPVYHERGRS